jgi:hypothetical protein
VQEATDFCVDWSAVTIGADGARVAASDFTELVLVDVAMDEAALLAATQFDALSQPDSWGWIFENADGRTSACASEMQELGNPFSLEEFVASAERTWVLWLSSSSDWLNVGDRGEPEFSHPTVVIPEPTSTSHDIVLADPI